MQFMYILNETPTDFARRNDPAEAGDCCGGSAALLSATAQAWIIVNGAGPQGTHAAATLPVRDGKRVEEDGPFADTKVRLGGFFVIEGTDFDAALDWAARALTTSVEARPVLPPMPAPAMAVFCPSSLPMTGTLRRRMRCQRLVSRPCGSGPKPA